MNAGPNGMDARGPVRPAVVLFDLDGTLSDSAPGIVEALRHAFAVTGCPPLDPAQERSLLGPPFHHSLPPLVGDDRFPAVLAAYREHYRTTMFTAAVYPGVSEVLDRLGAAGVTVGVATSKAEPFAVPIVEHLGLAGRVATVCGDTLDGGRPTKADVIAEALHRLGDPPGDRVRMVGDRSADVEGARAHGIDTIAVGWGYAMPGELAAAAPAHTVADADELAEVLGV